MPRIRSWKTWERGAPEVAVEIISESDAGEANWQQKLHAYRSIGVNELVRFEPEASPSSRLRIWDRTDGALMARAIVGDSAPSSALALHWIVAGAEGLPTALRIADKQRLIVPTHNEARKVAEARIRELEAELQRSRSGG